MRFWFDTKYHVNSSHSMWMSWYFTWWVLEKIGDQFLWNFIELKGIEDQPVNWLLFLPLCWYFDAEICMRACMVKCADIICTKCNSVVEQLPYIERRQLFVKFFSLYRLLEHGADRVKVTLDGETAFTLAVRAHCLAALNALLTDFEPSGELLETMLFRAIQ